MLHSRAPHRASAFPRAGFAVLIAAIAVLAAPPAWAHHPLGEEIEELTELLEAKPNDLGLLLQRAELLLLAGETRLAEADLKRIEQHYPTLPEPDLLRAAAMLQNGRLVAAEKLLGSVIARTQSSNAYRLRATARVALGRSAEAADDLAAAIQHARRAIPELYLERAQILVELGRLEEASATIDQGIQRCGHAVTLESFAADLDVRQGRVDQALARLERIEADMARPAPILARQGDVLRAAGREPGAWAAYSEALAAIEALPSGARRTPATAALETRVRAALEAAASEEQ